MGVGKGMRMVMSYFTSCSMMSKNCSWRHHHRHHSCQQHLPSLLFCVIFGTFLYISSYVEIELKPLFVSAQQSQTGSQPRVELVARETLDGNYDDSGGSSGNGSTRRSNDREYDVNINSGSRQATQESSSTSTSGEVRTGTREEVLLRQQLLRQEKYIELLQGQHNHNHNHDHDHDHGDHNTLVRDSDIGAVHCGMRYYDEEEKLLLEADRKERQLRAIGRAAAIRQRESDEGNSSGTYDNFNNVGTYDEPFEEWVAQDAFRLNNVLVNFHVMVSADGTGNIPDSSFRCAIRRLNVAFSNRDPIEEIWFTELQGEQCDITVDNVDDVLNDAQEAESFGPSSGITFALGQVTRYLTVCGSERDPPGCLNNDVPLPQCSNSDPLCVENGADYYAPADWKQCSASSTAPEMAQRVVLTDPVRFEPATHMNVFACEPTSSGTITLGFVLCIGGERFQDGMWRQRKLFGSYTDNHHHNPRC